MPSLDNDQINDYSDTVLQDACKAWGLTTPHRISEAENLIYKCLSPSGRVALRLTHSLHRDSLQLDAELKWLEHLSSCNLPVVKPRLSFNSKFVETFPIEKSTWYAIVFEWIEGKSIKPRTGKVSDDSIHSWGALTGQIVENSIGLNKSGTKLTRHNWYDSIPEQVEIVKNLGSEHLQLAEEIHQVSEQIKNLPISTGTYLLAHTDLHSGNVFQKENGDLVALDFDDCCYHYLLQEFAMPIYYSLHIPDSDLAGQAQHYFKHFLSGYRKFHDIDVNALDALPLFFKLRDLDLKAICYRWNIDPQSEWSQRVHHIYNHGNPISTLPWKKWALSI